jgi:hypothetical protein
MTRYWLDTEFIEDGKTIDLLSIGIVCEDGREFYAQVIDVDHDRASPWVKENVLPHFEQCRYGKKDHHLNGRCYDECPWDDREFIANRIRAFCAPEAHGKPEFWAYYADYDWVVLCQLFGTMMDLPKGWPMYCRDIKQLCDDLGNPQLPEQGKGEHNALADARWNKVAWDFLLNLRGSESPR